MPVGKVFNAAENQVLISPVSSYYQGKAIRAQQQEAEQMSELRGLQIEGAKQDLADAPSKREAAKQKALLQAENIQSQISARYATEERADLAAADEVLKPLFKMYSAEEDEDAALAKFNQNLPEAISRLSEKQQQAIVKGAGADYQYSHEEIMLAGLARRTYQDLADNDRHSARYQQAIDGGLKPGTPEFESFVLNQGGGDDLSEKEKEIALYKSLGENQEDAIDLAYGNITVTSSTDPMGNVTVTNSRTKEASKISARAARAANLTIPSDGEKIEQVGGWAGPSWSKPAAMINPAPNLSNSNISESQAQLKAIDGALMAASRVTGQEMMTATGIANITQRGINAVLQMASFNTLPRVFSEESDASAVVLQFNQAVRAGMVNSPRFPVWEQEVLTKLLPDPENISKDPEGEAIKFTRVLQYLKNQREKEVAFMEGRSPEQVDREPLGIKDDPIIIKSEKDGEQYPPGTWVMMNGRPGKVK